MGSTVTYIVGAVIGGAVGTLVGYFGKCGGGSS